MNCLKALPNQISRSETDACWENYLATFQDDSGEGVDAQPHNVGGLTAGKVVHMQGREVLQQHSTGKSNPSLTSAWRTQ